MFGLFKKTPQYAGNGQPTAPRNTGALGLLSGLFAFPGTPRYATAEDNSAVSGVILAPEPMDTATSEQVTAQPACTVPLPVAIVIQRSEN